MRRDQREQSAMQQFMQRSSVGPLTESAALQAIQQALSLDQESALLIAEALRRVADGRMEHADLRGLRIAPGGAGLVMLQRGTFK